MMIQPSETEASREESGPCSQPRREATIRSSRVLPALFLGSALTLLAACGGEGSDGGESGGSPKLETVTEWFDAAQTKKKAEGAMLLGQREGEWTWWYDSGQVAVRGQFTGGEATGTWVEWHGNGQKASEITWAGNEVRDGLAAMWYPNGRLRNEGTFEKNTPVGAHKGFYPNGQLVSEENYVDGLIDGPLVEYYDNGAKKQEGQFSAGKQVGTWRSFYPDGAKQSEGAFLDGLKTGTWTSWHPTGEVHMEMPYDDQGLIQGTVVRKHVDGSVEAELTYVDGLVQGEVTQTWPDGKTRSVGSWKDGMRAGEWRFFHKDGSLDGQSSGTFENNQRVADLDGNPVEPPAPQAGGGAPAGPGPGGGA